MALNLKTRRSLSLKEPVGVQFKDASGVSAAVSNLLKFRRMTIGGNLPSFVSTQETATGANSEAKKPKIKCENTYQLEPDADKKFKTTAVEQKTYEVLENELKTMKYNENTAGRLACRLSNIVKNEIKSMNMPRHRVVCQVVITEVRGPDMEAASRCLWDDRSDNYACISYENDTLLAIAMVYGVYMD